MRAITLLAVTLGLAAGFQLPLNVEPELDLDLDIKEYWEMVLDWLKSRRSQTGPIPVLMAKSSQVSAADDKSHLSDDRSGFSFDPLRMLSTVINMKGVNMQIMENSSYSGLSSSEDQSDHHDVSSQNIDGTNLTYNSLTELIADMIAKQVKEAGLTVDDLDRIVANQTRQDTGDEQYPKDADQADGEEDEPADELDKAEPTKLDPKFIARLLGAPMPESDPGAQAYADWKKSEDKHGGFDNIPKAVPMIVMSGNTYIKDIGNFRNNYEYGSLPVKVRTIEPNGNDSGLDLDDTSAKSGQDKPAAPRLESSKRDGNTRRRDRLMRLASQKVHGHDDGNTYKGDVHGHDDGNTYPGDVHGHDDGNTYPGDVHGHDDGNTYPGDVHGHDDGNSYPGDVHGHDDGNTSPGDVHGHDDGNTYPGDVHGHDDGDSSSSSSGQGGNDSSAQNSNVHGHDDGETYHSDVHGHDDGGSSRPILKAGWNNVHGHDDGSTNNSPVHGHDDSSSVHGHDDGSSSHGHDDGSSVHGHDDGSSVHGHDDGSSVHGHDDGSSVHGHDDGGLQQASVDVSGGGGGRSTSLTMMHVTLVVLGSALVVLATIAIVYARRMRIGKFRRQDYIVV